MEKIAVLIPCYNEELTVEKVVTDFKRELPAADIYVYDNNSKDKTADLASAAGAIVRKETAQGKGNVVRTMFKNIDADVYILVDGDDTYPADEVHKLIQPVLEGNADMVIGDRLSNGTYFEENKRGFHGFGNNLVKNLINFLFKSNINDIMTGYRVYSRRFVKNMPVMSSGFQIETEMTIFSLVYRMKLVEIPITYRDRPAGSESKLNTFSDGFKVLVKLFDLFKNYRPMLFFSCFSILFIILGLVAGIPVITEFIKTAFITKIPSAVLATSLFIIAFLLFMVGIILDAIKNQMCILFECQLNQFEYQERCKVG
ncbi:glycosyltransferase [Holdemania filiformis]|uniref:Glycosyltransferase n=1 Tax=Holdemania filiformis TaxID=61171 RepID=A0A412FRX2_9FIRM|nr:glycosyltransferase [Holdemania filiformis]RGR70963.1 glycosyltransferase [Holdemania filiformis]